MLSRVLREPLLHFFVLGALLFALYAWLNRGSMQAPDEIVVDLGRVQLIEAQYNRTWQRAPAEDELQALIDNWVREEILYREGIALGLDQSDAIVRRRVAQKMDFITDGMTDSAPDDAALQAWLDDHLEKYLIPPRYDLRQIYIDPARHGERLDGVISAALAALENDDMAVTGDSTMLPDTLASVSSDDVARVFGSELAGELDALPVGQWVGPLRSGYGLHLVLVDEKAPGYSPALAEVRRDVERDLLNERANAAKDAFYQALRERYTIVYADDVATASR